MSGQARAELHVDALDFTHLTERVSSDEVRAFRNDPNNRQLWDVARLPENHPVGTLVGFVFITLVLLCIDVLVIQLVFFLKPLGAAVGAAAVALVFLVPTWLSLGVIVRGAITKSPWARWLRMLRFAADNSIRFSIAVFLPDYPGTVFQRGGRRRASDVVTFGTPTHTQIGNYRYDGEVELGRVRVWGFIRIRLDRELPHMLLQARSRSRLIGSRFPVGFADHQTLSLEGDFDRYFRLFVPRDYQRDALYVFTPDLMAILIDEGSQFDIEIVDGWMNIYSHHPFAMQSPASYETLRQIVESIGSKTRRQTARYWDDRLHDRQLNAVAAGGRRLRNRANLVYVIGGGAIVLTIVGVLFARVVAG